MISVLSALFAGLGGAVLWYATSANDSLAVLLYVMAVLCIQARLLCNLFDGMVAIEGGKKSAAGAIFNELPDRISDTLLFLGAGYGAGGVWGATLGWSCALGAMATAYVRLLGVSAGLTHDFAGPLAKQQRMAALTLGCVGAAFARAYRHETEVWLITLGVIAVGAWYTAARRTLRSVRQLEEGA